MKKQILILLDNYPYEIGEYSFIKTELKTLLENFEVSILCTSSKSEQEVLVDDRINVFHIHNNFNVFQKVVFLIRFFFSSFGWMEFQEILKCEGSFFPKIKDSINYYAVATRVKKYISKNGFFSDDLIVYSYWFNAPCLAFLMLNRRGVKVISRIHGYDLYNERCIGGRQPYREYMDSKIDKLVFIAQSGMEYYLSRWGDRSLVGEKYLLIPVGSDNHPFDAKEKGLNNGFRLVSCSSCIPLKRVELIIEALVLIDDILISWIHFGDGICLDSLKNLANDKLQGKKNISYEFAGYVDNDSIHEYYRTHYVDCFITTSSTEGSPVSIQEAMSYGIPIIGTSVGEIPYMIEDCGEILGENPSLFDISEAIKKLKNLSLNDSMRNNARARWEKCYNADINAKKIVTVLEDI